VRGGKRCKKHKECCSGICITVTKEQGSKQGKEGLLCCDPEAAEATCEGSCGELINNCGQTIDCGKCPRESCVASDECAEGECLEEICCPPDDVCPSSSPYCCPADRSPTSACCAEAGACCECFQGDVFGPDYCCPDPAQICGTYPNDVCCANQTECVNGACVKPVYVCPHEVGGEPVDCRELTGAGCCNGLCCPADKPICLNGACHPALPACSYPDSLSCPAGSTCTANVTQPEGVCCSNMGTWSPGVDGTGEPIIVNVCCPLNEKWGNDDGFGFCPRCVPRDFCGCSQCTSRTSTPRIGR
jgi:hypothetical protein